MNNNRIKVSAGALILAALIYYTADFGTLACVAVPVLIHELGHIVCLRLLGLRICGFKAELRGLCMGYAGCTSGFGRILAAAAGPAAYRHAAAGGGAVADVDGQGSGGAGRVDMAAAVAAGESCAWAEKRAAVNQIIIYCR